jgi:hypothetical protein
MPLCWVNNSYVVLLEVALVKESMSKSDAA